MSSSPLHPEVLCYLAGPFSGPDEQSIDHNIDAMVTLATIVTETCGCMVVCPHANTADRRFRRLHDYPFWIAGTLELMRRCDVVFLRYNWHASSGARGEVAEAVALGIPCFDVLDHLQAWLEGRETLDFKGVRIKGRENRHDTPACHAELRRIFEAARNVVRNRDSAGLRGYVDTLTRVMGEEPA